MARRTQTYAIRLAVKGGGQVNAPRDRHRRGHLPDGVASLTARMSGCRRAAGMIGWIKATQGW